jgi:hypothetical protein
MTTVVVVVVVVEGQEGALVSQVTIQCVTCWKRLERHGHMLVGVSKTHVSPPMPPAGLDKMQGGSGAAACASGG